MEQKKQHIKKNNHYYPFFHQQKWINKDGKIFYKEEQKIEKIPGRIENRLFAEEFYYSNGQEDETLENKLAKVECIIAPIIKKIDNAKTSICLTGKELELLKLYIFLCSIRQHYTTEVIKEDKTGVYQSNNYLFGVHREYTQDGVIAKVDKVCEKFLETKKKSNDISSPIEHCALSGDFNFVNGLHIVILRSSNNSLMISNKICIIENTMDSDFLYSYVPMSPSTAILLVKTRYYLDFKCFEQNKRRLSLKNNGFGEDPYLSAVFGNSEDRESILCCSYAYAKLAPSTKNEIILLSEVRNPVISIIEMNDFEINSMNSIFYEDGDFVLYCKQEDLENSKQKMNFRTIY